MRLHSGQTKTKTAATTSEPGGAGPTQELAPQHERSKRHTEDQKGLELKESRESSPKSGAAQVGGPLKKEASERIDPVQGCRAAWAPRPMVVAQLL